MLNGLRWLTALGCGSGGVPMEKRDEGCPMGAHVVRLDRWANLAPYGNKWIFRYIK